VNVSWFKRWFAYVLGMGAAKAILGERGPAGDADRAQIRNMTEEEIRTDEKRFDEDARRLDTEDAAAKRRGA
jgi:hypothetical protein